MASIILKTLKPENIKKGVTILKTEGAYEGGTVINNEDITVNSSTVEQQFQAGEGYTGLGTVTVNPYTLDSKSVDSSTSSQTVTSDEDGMSSVTVAPYTLDSKTVDSSTVSQTVISDVDGLSSVTVNPYILDSKSVDSSTSSQTVTSDEDGMSSVTIVPYTLEAKTVNPSASAQLITSSTADGMSSLTLNPVTAAVDSNITTGNIKEDVTILGVTGTMSSDSDWVLDIKNGATVLDVNSGLYDVNNGLNKLFMNTSLTSATFRDPYINGENVFFQTFYGLTSLTSLSFPNVTTISGYYALGSIAEIGSGNYPCTISFPVLNTISGQNCLLGAFARHCSGDVVFPELLQINGSNCMASAFANSSITSLSFPKLERITADSGFNKTCNGAPITSLSMPNLVYKSVGSSSVFYQFMAGGLTPSLEATPELFKYNSADGEYFSYSSSSGSRFSSLTLNIPTGYTYSNGWNNSGGTTYICFNYLATSIPDSTILHILRQLGNVTDYDQVNYTVVFNERTIQDNADGDYTAAVNKLVTAGWTINNLTITPY